MKEITYEDWQKDPTPRMMWVWDSIENNKLQRKVIYFLNTKITYQVVALTGDETSIESFRHCAEIEKQRRMTNKELSHWLREKPTREWKRKYDSQVFTIHSYREEWADEEVHKDVRIREDDSEWREPLMEVEE